MLTVTIDERQTTVAPGTTVLEAARALGIEIPTLCFVEGLEPASSCFMCAVQIEGRPSLSPACSMPVADGMVIDTCSDDVREARKMALELLLSDHAGECIAPCRAICPAGLDIPGFMREVAAGRNDRAMEVIADRLALPAALGRVCPRLCEDGCHRCQVDEGLAIGTMHRYVPERDLASGSPHLPERAHPTGKTVAIVGAGPAGLTAAYYLLPRGYDCTLFDAHPLPGGMLRYGIPEYRLPSVALEAEIDPVRRLGAKFRMNSRWGTDFSLEDLRKDFDAVFLAIGAQHPQGLRCEGEELALSGIDFLERVAHDDRPELGDRVIVVGGGNTAMDACRTAVRLGPQRVTVYYRRTRQEMPCLLEEVEGAEAEGVHIEYLVAPTGLERDDNGTLRLTCVRMELGEPDASGRRRPIPVPGSEFVTEASTVISAIGQRVDLSLASSEGIDCTDWGIAADPKTLATNLPGVFSGGDAVLGPDLAVRAVAAGRRAAVSIDEYLTDRQVTGGPELATLLMRSMSEDEQAALYRRIERRARVHAEQLDPEQRSTNFDEVEDTLTEADAAREAERCLNCGCCAVEKCDLLHYATQYGANPYRFSGERRRFSQDFSHPDIVYEPGKCIMCDACVRIAAEANEALGVATIGRGFNVTMAVPFDQPLSEGLEKVARQCAEACPTGALSLRTQFSCKLGACDTCSLASATHK